MSSCSMETLVMARRDGRLANKELASVERHLDTCASCSELAAELEDLAELSRKAGDIEPLGAMEHRRRRLAVLRAATAPRAEAPRRWRHVYALAAVAAVGMLVVWFARPVQELASHHGTPRQARLASARTNVSAFVSEAPAARFDRQTSTTDSGQLERVRLYDGTVDVRVDVLADGHRFIVATSDAEVEVRGTRFTVHAEEGILREVIVQEGRVEVRHGTATTMLGAGESYRAPARVASHSNSDEPDMADVPSSRVGPMRPAAPGASTSGTPPVVAPGPTPMSEPEASSVPETPKSRERSEASKEFEAAMTKLENGDYTGATDALGGFSKKHPDDARSEDADFLRIVALQRAGRHAAAANAARNYLAKYPNGSRRTEAAAIANRPR